MIEDAAGRGSVWWAVAKERAVGCWWQLLVVELLHLVVLAVLSTVVSGAGAVRSATAVLLFAVGAVLGAWRWSARLRLLDGERDLVRALRTAGSPVLRLALLTTAVNPYGLAWLASTLLSDDDSLMRSLAPVLFPLGLCLAAVFALLPMAVLLEGRGLGRSWRLLRGSRSSVLRVGLVVLGQAALSVLLPGSMLSLLIDPACAVLLFASYRLSLDEENSRTHEGF
ncbi:hypothetical protein HUT16_28760 [Kitasatospora sp. NA04385]|uniref:hypothetical protein n=1 Tax=Kitasatospora sp. NA04385 TaxID=2742135 RepID=UPI0015904A3A|nr:hypothetical protein [Kitasatospora sp. NA04385]QKW22541.1 hypothetical protein HUT16_28760 [Kitasatospora sp. NA04385]